MLKKILPKISFVLLVILGAIILITIAILITWPILTSPNIAPGADTGSHTYIGLYVSEYFKQFGQLPHILPYWYANWEILHNSPRLPALFIGALNYFLNLNSPEKLSQLSQVIILIIINLSAYFVFLRRLPWFNALIGTIFFGFSQAILVDLIWAGGSLPRSLAAAAIPPAFLFFNNLLEGKKIYSNLIFLVLSLSFAILAHPLVGIMIMIMLLVYGIFRGFFDDKIQKRGFILIILAMTLTGLLCAFYFIPFFFERTGWTSLPTDLPGTAFTVKNALFRLGAILTPSILIFLLFKRHKNPTEMALFFTVIFGFIFSLGDAGLVYRPFRFFGVYPFIASFFYTFGISYLVAGTFNLKRLVLWAKTLVIIFFVVIMSYQLWTGYVSIKTEVVSQGKRYSQPPTHEVLNRVKNLNSSARILPMAYPFPDLIVWWASLYKIPMVEGWYYSTTIQGKHVAWIYDAIDYGWLDYGVRRLNQLNVKSIIANSNFYSNITLNQEVKENFLEFVESLKKNNFSEDSQIIDPQTGKIAYTLFNNPTPSNYFQPVQEKILVIGKDASIANTVTPGAIQGDSPYIDDYNEELLSPFESLILTGFKYRNRDQAEKIVKNFIKRDGKVIIDFNRAEGTKLEEIPTFLNVSGQQQIAQSNILTETTSDDIIPQELLPKVFEKPKELNIAQAQRKNVVMERQEMKEWRYIEYFNLDGRLIWRRDDDTGLGALIGYKMVENKPVWFVGPNFFYHTFLTHDQTQVDFLEYILNSGKQNSGLKSETSSSTMPEIKVMFDELEQKKIHSSSEKPLPLLVSYTYSPHWKAYLDGEKIQIYNLEDLMFVVLPAGDHELEFRYQEIKPHVYGRIITGLTLLILLGIAFLGVRRYFIERKSHES